MPQGWDLGVPWGVGSIFFSKFNQSWCVSYLHEWHMQQHNFWVPAPPGALGRGQRSNIIKISITKSISKIFRSNSVRLLTNERYKTSQMGFSFDCLGHAPGLGLGGTVGGWGGQNFFFLKFNLT